MPRPALARNRTVAAEKQGVAPEAVDITNVTAFYVLKGAYIDGALDQAGTDHGSMEACVREGLGLSEDEIERLRDELLDR